MKHKIILDCDPGHDDAIAILLAARQPETDLLAITTVAGNQSLEKTTRNALKVCSLANIRDVPVARGMDRPLVRPARFAPEIHGESGMDGPDIPEPDIEPVPQHAVDLIVEKLMNSDGDITLVATGPLSNIATAIRREPAILPKIKAISLMGGAIGVGNRMPAAEFNIWADPEAAAIVFDCERPITMSPLEVNVFGFPAPPVHDPCAVAAVIDPTILHAHTMRVEIETTGEWTTGRTVCDVYGVLGKQPNARVGYALDVPRFWEMVISTILMYE
ncbi:MAG: nucleoside hydrolase [Chloroflexi bacterium]|nr:MAG: nucleoside hydrolase [Chloroflexota bacterium]